MKIIDLIILFLLLVLLGFGLFVLWYAFPFDKVNYNEFVSNSSSINISSETVVHQFYPNMRYKDKRISYRIEEACTQTKAQDIISALKIIEEKTRLTFYPSSNAEIIYLCNEIAPDSMEEGHFIAGEGGPSAILNSSLFSIILTGKVSRNAYHAQLICTLLHLAPLFVCSAQQAGIHSMGSSVQTAL